MRIDVNADDDRGAEREHYCDGCGVWRWFAWSTNREDWICTECDEPLGEDTDDG